ncbi:hypothetical protein [Marinimicrobium sp. ABcell2]|uniref:hypothetical protein n=1 Tax=Marinimicrobium sp. ABcell2 TaxID=3069751 RepID=UPI0027B165E8|nr:hypothetical protein [Marinimicrobium sp. ABcell2]MDQ2077621.1 hypothetical protein [Marinimicrobium sp. ABcell2]
MRALIASILLGLTFASHAQTLLVHVDFDQHGYYVNNMRVLDRTFNATSPRPAQKNAVRYQFLDVDGNILKEGIVHNPLLVAGEFHGNSSEGIDGEVAQKANGSFMIRVPYVESMATLSLSKLEASDDTHQTSYSGSGKPSLAQSALKPSLLNEFDLQNYLNQPKNQ